MQSSNLLQAQKKEDSTRAFRKTNVASSAAPWQSCSTVITNSFALLPAQILEQSPTTLPFLHWFGKLSHATGQVITDFVSDRLNHRVKLDFSEEITTRLLKEESELRESRENDLQTPLYIDQLFSADQMSVVRGKSHLRVNDLYHALKHGELSLYYQPQVDLESGRLEGMEALLRWHHPQFGWISPSDFIPLAEETGLIIPMGYWVLRSACLQYQAWLSQGMPPLKISVNLSQRQLAQTDLVEQIKAVLVETGIPSYCLELEITETAMSANSDRAIDVFSQLQHLGIQIAIDDFGTGYSSLAFLKNLPIHTLKIDRSFLEDLMVVSKNRVILQSIIDLGHRLKLKIIAEGIENEEQLTILKMLNCDYGQGYLLSRPLNLDGINQYLNLKQTNDSFLEQSCPV